MGRWWAMNRSANVSTQAIVTSTCRAGRAESEECVPAETRNLHGAIAVDTEMLRRCPVKRTHAISISARDRSRGLALSPPTWRTPREVVDGAVVGDESIREREHAGHRDLDVPGRSRGV